MVVIITEVYFVKYRKEWLSKYDNFMLLVYTYLYRFCSIEHYVPVTIKDMVSYFKFKPDRNSGRVNDKFKSVINDLINMGYISFIGCYSNDTIKSFVDVDNTDKDIKYAVNDNNMIWFKLNNFDDEDYWNPNGDFIKFTYSELDAILNIKNIKKSDKVASTYMNIKKWISATETATSRFVAFPSENKLAGDIGCSPKSVQEYTDQLISAKLLYKKNYGSYYRLLKGEEIKQNANTVYALEEKYLDGKYDKNALIEYLKFNYQMIGDDFESFNQPLNNHQKNRYLDNNKSDSSLMCENNKDISVVKHNEKDSASTVPVATIVKDISIDSTNVDVSSIGNDTGDNDKMPWEDEDLDELLFGA